MFRDSTLAVYAAKTTIVILCWRFLVTVNTSSARLSAVFVSGVGKISFTLGLSRVLILSDADSLSLRCKYYDDTVKVVATMAG
jgi:hypothetical protein